MGCASSYGKSLFIIQEVSHFLLSQGSQRCFRVVLMTFLLRLLTHSGCCKKFRVVRFPSQRTSTGRFSDSHSTFDTAIQISQPVLRGCIYVLFVGVIKCICKCLYVYVNVYHLCIICDLDLHIDGRCFQF